MSETEQKIAKIKQLLTSIQTEIKNCRSILRGQTDER